MVSTFPYKALSVFGMVINIALYLSPWLEQWSLPLWNGGLLLVTTVSIATRLTREMYTLPVRSLIQFPFLSQLNVTLIMYNNFINISICYFYRLLEQNHLDLTKRDQSKERHHGEKNRSVNGCCNQRQRAVFKVCYHCNNYHLAVVPKIEKKCMLSQLRRQ